MNTENILLIVNKVMNMINVLFIFQTKLPNLYNHNNVYECLNIMIANIHVM